MLNWNHNFILTFIWIETWPLQFKACTGLQEFNSLYFMQLFLICVSSVAGDSRARKDFPHVFQRGARGCNQGHLEKKRPESPGLSSEQERTWKFTWAECHNTNTIFHQHILFSAFWSFWIALEVSLCNVLFLLLVSQFLYNSICTGV